MRRAKLMWAGFALAFWSFAAAAQQTVPDQPPPGQQSVPDQSVPPLPSPT